jgi:hypothetical protein
MEWSLGGTPLRDLLGLEPFLELPETIRTQTTLQCIDRIRCMLDLVLLVAGLRWVELSPTLITVVGHARELSLRRGKLWGGSNRPDPSSREPSRCTCALYSARGFCRNSHGSGLALLNVEDGCSRGWQFVSLIYP